MSKSPLNHPSSNRLLGDIKSIFEKKVVYQSVDRHLIFVCGGPVKSYSRSARNRFIKYAQKELKKFRVFLVEWATHDLTQHSSTPDFFNLADIETQIADVCECIVLFPESPGSIAELGYFSNNINILKKLLVVNDITHQNDSFINKGIENKINKESDFTPVIYINSGNPEFDHIRTRLQRLPSKNRSKLDYSEFSSMPEQQKLFVVFHIVYIFGALRLESVIYGLDKIFGNVKKNDIRFLLSILIAAGYVDRRGHDQGYYVPLKNVHHFLEIENYDIDDMKARATLFFQKYHQESYDVIRGL